jgi:radical SAM superfamily enzyme YgiQ (UPF0313 family)
MKTCVINPPWEVENRTGIRAGCRFPNLTLKNTNRYVPFPFLLAYTASYLESQGIEVLLIDGCAERCSVTSFCQRIAAFSPDLIVAETSTTSLGYDLDVLTELRAHNPSAHIAIYGSHTDARPQDALDTGVVDWVIQGEPEITTYALAQAIDTGEEPKGILGLAYKDLAGTVRMTPRRSVISDIDMLPYPKRDTLPMERYNVPGFPTPVVYMYGGRGCPFKCNFCLWPQTTLKGAFRPRSPEKIVAEMCWILEHYPRTRSFFFDDDTFNLGRDRMLYFAEEMHRRGLRIPWGCNARADNWDREILEKLISTGLFTLRIGIESGDQDVLDRTGKNLDLDEVRTMLHLSHTLGIENHIMFIIGLPGETHESVEQTIRFIQSVPCHSVQFSVATPFPGTEFYQYAAEQGHLVTQDWSKYSGFDHVVVRTEAMTAEDVGRALARARRRIYFSPRFIRRRLGYIRNAKDVSALARKAWRLMSTAAFDRTS